MINKKATSFLLPLYFVALLALMVMLGYVSYYQVTEDTPRIGEASSAVMDAYSQAEAIRWYADQAAELAVNNAVQQSTPETLEENAQELFLGYLRSYPPRPIAAQIQTRRTADQIQFETTQDVLVPIRFGRETEDTQLGGVFTQWPLPRQANAYWVSSLFGKRDITGGSTNHPGIDIPAVLQTPVYAVADSQVISLDEDANWLYLQTQNGWVCGYYHVQPTVAQGDLVGAGQQVAIITDDGYRPHLDLRCYNPNILTQEQEALELFGDQHVGASYTQPTDTTYAATFTAGTHGEQVFLDTYCLFSASIRSSIQEYYTQKPEDLATVSGFEYRSGETIEQQLEQTCNAYWTSGLFIGDQSSVTQQYVRALIDDTFENEGEACFDEGDEWSKYGITQRTYDAYTGDQSTKEVICNIERSLAREIYEAKYFYEPGFDEFSPEIIPGIFDAGVNQGVGAAKEMLNNILQEQGVLEEETSDSTVLASATNQLLIAGFDVNTLYADERIRRYRETRNFDQYGDAWIARANKYRQPQDFASYISADELRGVGSYKFSLQTQAAISAEQRQTLSNNRDLSEQLSDCSFANISCIQETLPDEFAVCTDYLQQLKDTVIECAPQLQSGCSCFVPTPNSREFAVTLRNTTATYQNERIPTNWVIADSDEQPQIQLQSYGEDFDYLAELNRNTLPEGKLYLQLETSSTGYNLIVSAENQTQVCEQEVIETYCGESREVEVSHELR